MNEGKELKEALNNSALKIEIFSPFPNLPTYWRETPKQRTNNEDCWWEKIRDNRELDLLQGYFTALSVTVPACSSWMWASLCARIAANSWRDTHPPSSPLPTEQSVLNSLNVGKRAKKVFTVSRLTCRCLYGEVFFLNFEQKNVVTDKKYSWN